MAYKVSDGDNMVSVGDGAHLLHHVQMGERGAACEEGKKRIASKGRAGRLEA